MEYQFLIWYSSSIITVTIIPYTIMLKAKNFDINIDCMS
jgi:hypothetical protein